MVNVYLLQTVTYLLAMLWFIFTLQRECICRMRKYHHGTTGWIKPSRSRKCVGKCYNLTCLICIYLLTQTFMSFLFISFRFVSVRFVSFHFVSFHSSGFILGFVGIYRPIQQYTQLQRPRDSHVHDTPTDQGILISTFCKQTWRWETPIFTGKTVCVCVWVFLTIGYLATPNSEDIGGLWAFPSPISWNTGC